MKKKRKKYPVYYLKFLDHSLDTPSSAGPIVCEVFGVLWKQDKYSYYVNSWVCQGDVSDNNNETYTILKSTVIQKKRLA